MDVDLEEIRAPILDCQSCSLREGCTQVVFGEGNPAARMVILGDGPGAEEDQLGRPFVGTSGQLLDKILAACGWDRFTHTYVLNVVKCRPPKNRPPTPDEVAACRPNLDAQLLVLQPQIIVLLGATALQAMLGPEARVTKLRGCWIHRDGIWYMPTYHPAALLRDPSKKKDVWHDFKMVMEKYKKLFGDRGVTVPIGGRG